ncbi:hypothetical protein [Chelativorans sp. Marseille-P2723]|uniref:hypothetical protein n=1 Tax=Chelativorans sp. Marseille-P2723 TaxID=2709133 RepID=UPI00156DF090|nr:hypothetical protein [Chelativorans sp. Marseille-P2723]
MLNTLITSQHYIDEEIVAQKMAANDFEVQVSPAFEIGGEMFRVLMDGHHSLAAALNAGVDPIIVEQTASDNDRVALLQNGDIETFLEACWMDGEYRYAVSGKAVW